MRNVEPEPARVPEYLQSDNRDELLAWLYRPLDRQDMHWMTQLGYEWPLDDAKAQAELDRANNYIEIGKEHQGAHHDLNTETVYGARQALLDMFPAALEVFDEYANYYLNSQRSPPVTDNFVGTIRFHDRNGSNLDHKSPLASAVHTNTKTILNSLDILYLNGLSGVDILRENPFIGNLSVKLIQTKFRTMHGLAWALGWSRDTYKEDVNRAVESRPVALNYSLDSMHILARIGSVLFRVQKPDISHLNLLSEPLERTVAAYLEHGNAISTSKGLLSRARRYTGEYTKDELRGYIAQHAGDPVVKRYLRSYPIDEKEQERLPQHTELPSKRDFWNDTKYDITGYKTAAFADGKGGLEHRLRNMVELKSPKQTFLLDLISDGIKAEANGRNDDRAIKRGRWARQILTASYAAKVLDLKYSTGSEVFQTEDATQEAMARLMEAILTAAQRKKDKRPKELWPWLQERITAKKRSAS